MQLNVMRSPGSTVQPFLGHQVSADLPGVRHMCRTDIPGLCDLFAGVFRRGSDVRRESIALALEQTYLTSPGDRVAPASLVEIGADGRIDAFMGIMTMSARFADRTLRVGVLGNFMARDARRAKAVVRLSRATLAERFDVWFTDTANQTSLGICRALKFSLLPVHSLEWVKVLRPVEMSTFLMGRRVPALVRGLAPFARGLDLGAQRLAFASLTTSARGPIRDETISFDGFADEAQGLFERFRLHPDWTNRSEVHWLLEQAARKTRNGPLQCRKVTDGNGKTLGLYLLYAKAGAPAHALQILAARHQESVVLDALIKRAHLLGAVAVRGAANPLLVEGLMKQRGIVYHHVAASTCFTRQPDLVEALASDDIVIGGLLGETWTQLSTEDFR